MAEIERQTETARVAELIRRCEVSRQQRRAQCETLRMCFDRGTAVGPRATVNKLKSHLDRVASYLYAPDAVRFGIHLPVSVREIWLAAAEMARDEFRERWRDSGADLAVSALLEWALVYGSTVAKVEYDPSTGFRVGYIAPWDFGMSMEDKPMLDEQDVMTHYYMLSMPQIERWLEDHPNESNLLAIAREHASTNKPSNPRSGLVISNVVGVWPNSTVQGGFPGDPDTYTDMLSPQVDEPTVTFVDCWERVRYRRRPAFGKKQEIFEDWRVSTMVADANVLFLQRRNPVMPWTRTATDVTLPAEHPFVMMVPRPVPDYAWGRSELAELRLLQNWMEGQLEKMRDNFQMQLDPSKFFSGVPDFEEAGRAMNTPGGGYGSQDPGAKMTPYSPAVGPEVFQFLSVLEKEFGEVSGIPSSLSEPGSVPGGVRSTGQFSMVAGIGAGRIRRMALTVEDPIAQIATKGFRILQRHETEPYTLRTGQTFLLAQLPPGLTIRVNAHSSAPIFAEQTIQKAAMLQKMGALGPEDAVELVDPPNKDELKEKARKMAENRAELAKEKLSIEHEKATRGRAPKK